MSVSGRAREPGLRQVVRMVRPFARPVRRALVVGVLLAITEIALALAQPWPVSVVVDDVLGPGRNDSATTVLALAVTAVVVLAAAAAVTDYWSTRLLSAAGLHMGNGLRDAVFAHLQRLSLRYHGAHPVGDLSTRVTGDVDRTQDLAVQTLAVLIPNTLLVVGMAGVMFAVDPGFTLLALGTTPPLVFATFRATRRLRTASRRSRAADGRVAASATEGLGAIHVVQAFAMEDRQSARFGVDTRESLTAGLEAVRWQARFSPVVDLTSAGAVAAVLWFGAHRVMDGRMSLGVLLVFLSYLGTLYKPVKQLAKLSATLSRGVAAGERVAAVLAEEPDVADRPGAVPAPRLSGRIAFRDVHCSYGREPVLRGVDLEIAAGECVAVVGPTGAGKSTIAALVPRLMDVGSGAVLVDGRDVRALTLASLRAQVSMVLQDTLLMRGTLRDNIAWGCPGATRDRVERAARLALVDEFAVRLPDGLDTRVGERGAGLSGGQRQRIAIARAILRDAPILILDEPTSAVDPVSEELLMEALRNLPGGRTTLMIAHRLTTVRTADRVVVMDGGRVVEQGAHDELLERGGHFHRLAVPAGTRGR